MTSPQDRWISARDGTRLFVRDWQPDRPAGRAPVFCLSGITRNSTDFSDLAAHLAAQGRRVLAMDYRGRALSEKAADPSTYAPSVYIDDLRNVLAALNLHRVVALGTSLGGFLAMGMAVAMPTALAGAILNDAGPEILPSNVGRIVDYVSRDPAFPDWPAAVEGQKTMLPDMNLDDAGWLRLAKGCFKEGPDGLIHADWDTAIGDTLRKAGAPPPLWPYFNALGAVPTLAIRGDLSQILTEDCFNRMADAHPTLRRVTVPNQGHAPTLDEPECRSAIDEFLAAIP